MEKDTNGARPDKIDWKRELLINGLIIACAFVAVWLLDTFIIINAVVPSGSMENTIPSGARVIGSRLSYNDSTPERYDIVVFHYPDDEKQLFVKRVIGLPGETVTIIDGKVYINDETEPLDDSFIAEPMEGSFGPYVVPEGCYFMMGDNRNNSLDSRYWVNTFVAEDKILGKALFVWYPFSSWGTIN
ncbi:MAG: signal peptidase I [Lachnospiraceae bacterium]